MADPTSLSRFLSQIAQTPVNFMSLPMASNYWARLF
jgi:hypothetical protein